MICSNRFAYNLLQQPEYKGQKIHIFSSTDESTWQSEFITSMWPSLYCGVTQVRRKSSNFPSTSQFGVENIPARIENLIDEDREKMLDCDVYRSYWIDGLDWLDYPECRAALNFYPRAEKQLNYPELNLPEKYIALHPMSRPNSERRLEDFYIQRLIKDFAAKIPVVVITETKYLDFYSFAANWSNVTILPTDLYESWFVIDKAAAFIGVDSSLYHMSKSTCKPHFVFNPYCQQPFTAAPFQSIRWIEPHTCFPPNYDINFVKNHVLKCIDNIANFLYPMYATNNQDVDNAIVRRKFLN